MIYAIHRETRKHFVIDEETHDWDGPMGEYRFVKADADGWILHDGKECPLPEGTRCDVRIGARTVPNVVAYDWLHWERVTHYRTFLDTKPSDPEAPEWDGESWPPVGGFCEWKHKRAALDQWVPCQIVGYHDKWVFVVDDSYGGMPSVKKLATWQFRPIRSEEERAVEEMAEIACSGFPSRVTISTCRALYRAGYRKTGGDA